ncbi:hypothetical protein ACLOJK_009600 [Asimina triloba]
MLPNKKLLPRKAHLCIISVVTRCAIARCPAYGACHPANKPATAHPESFHFPGPRSSKEEGENQRASGVELICAEKFQNIRFSVFSFHSRIRRQLFSFVFLVAVSVADSQEQSEVNPPRFLFLPVLRAVAAGCVVKARHVLCLRNGTAFPHDCDAGKCILHVFRRAVSFPPMTFGDCLFIAASEVHVRAYVRPNLLRRLLVSGRGGDKRCFVFLRRIALAFR